MNDNNKKISAIDGGEVSTARLETLTDGIFAIAMTLLVLDLHVPDLAGQVTSAGLWAGLLPLWPRFLSFVLSFIILGMFWVAHHTEYRFIKKLDHKLIWQNLFYLLFVSFLPFSAGLIGRFPQNQIAIVVYGLHLMAMVLIHYFMWQHASGHRDLVVDDLDPRINKLAHRLTFFAIILYVIALSLSFWNINITLIIYGLIPIPYIFGWIYNLV